MGAASGVKICTSSAPFLRCDEVSSVTIMPCCYNSLLGARSRDHVSLVYPFNSSGKTSPEKIFFYWCSKCSFFFHLSCLFLFPKLPNCTTLTPLREISIYVFTEGLPSKDDIWKKTKPHLCCLWPKVKSQPRVRLIPARTHCRHVRLRFILFFFKATLSACTTAVLALRDAMCHHASRLILCSAR